MASDDERPIQAGFEHFLSLTRLFALIPVLFLLFDAVASFIYGTDIMVRSVTGLISEPAHVGGRLGVFLIVMDTFLVGATLMVAAFGFYELFVVRSPRHKYRLPGWLRMRDLEDMKARVVSMLILVAAITFVDRTVESQDEQEVLFLGIGISIIIGALTFFLWFSKRNDVKIGPGPATVTSGSGPDGGPGDGTPSGGTAGGGTAGGGTAGGGTAGGGRQERDTSARGPASGTADAGAPTATIAPTTGLRLATAQGIPADGAWADLQVAGAPAQGPGRRPTTQDLPAAGAAEDLQVAAATERPRRLTAILGVARRDGDWATSPSRALAVAGYARIDLRDADLAGPDFQIRANAVLGVVSITVPPDTRVVESGVAVLGLRLGRTGARCGSARRRLIVSGLSVFGVVRVRCGSPALAQPAGHPPSFPAKPAISVVTADTTPADPTAGEASRL